MENMYLSYTFLVILSHVLIISMALKLNNASEMSVVTVNSPMVMNLGEEKWTATNQNESVKVSII